LPVAHPERLYSVAFQGAGVGGQVATYDSCSYPMFRQLRAAVKDQAESVAVSYAERIDLTYGRDEETEKAYGPLDVLVNNAGVFQFDPLEAVTETEFHREFNTNVLGPILMTQEAVKRFGPEGGSVINIGSVVVRNPPPGAMVYVATGRVSLVVIGLVLFVLTLLGLVRLILANV